jgi:hypothetical protein
MNYTINRVIQYYYSQIKRKWKPDLFPELNLMLEKSHKTDIIEPANYQLIKSKWKPNNHWSNPETNQIYLSKFKNVHVSSDGIVFNRLKSYPGSYIFSEFYKKFDNFYLLDVYKYYKLKNLKDSSNFLLIFDHWSKINYFHWMCDSLPKLMMLKKLKTIKNLKIIITEESPNYVLESLIILGFEPFFFKNSEYLKIPNLYHISYLAISGFSHPVINKLVIDLKKNYLPSNNKKKYYLSRNKSITRSISNEFELIKLLIKFDFEVIQTENKTLQEQILLFSDCDFLISPHGAGLTNMLFMPVGSKIIEIGHSEIQRQPLCYWHLANELNHAYNYIPTYADENEIFRLNSVSLNLIIQLLC